MISVTWKQSSRDYLTVPDELRQALVEVRKQRPEIRITIEPVYQTRTAEQNAFFHAKLGELAQESGADKEWLKNQIKMVAVNMGYGYDMVGEKLIPHDSSKATIEEMEILIEALYKYAFDNGHYLRREK